MLLSEMASLDVRDHVKQIYDLLLEIINGNYPMVDMFTSEEIQRLMKGERVGNIKSPFVGINENMEIKKFPLMRLQTTRDVYFRKRQMNLNVFFDTINKMLEILEIEAENIIHEECLSASRMY